MILHASVPARDPQAAATTVAELLGGAAIPFGPTKGSWTAIGPDPLGNVVEVVPLGTEFHPGEKGAESRPGNAATHSGFHLLLESPMEECAIMALAKRCKATALRASRGIFGELIEFWIDGSLLIEILPPLGSIAYRKLLVSEELRMEIAARLRG